MAEINGVMMQAFHWYTPEGGVLWDELAARAKKLSKAGFTALWLPPAYKCLEGDKAVGYSIYDLYDWENSTRRAPSPRNTAPASST